MVRGKDKSYLRISIITKIKDAFITTRKWRKHRKDTLESLGILALWKDMILYWIYLKYTNKSYPVKLAKCTVQRCIAGEPSFPWWTQDVMSKYNQISGKFKI